MLQNRAPGMGGEIAFFGGSFTGIDREVMLFLLQTAKEYIDRSIVDGIRLSTRPDTITPEILSLLKQYPVKTIELGIQSLSDRVLRASGRGHSAQDSLRACKLVKDAGFSLVGQMMCALPSSSGEDEVMTARTLCTVGIDAARIYPTVVLPNTPLAEMARRGAYLPLTQKETIARSADVLTVFLDAGVPVIRLGLCSTDEVRGSTDGFHDAIGELAYNEIYRRRTESDLRTLNLTDGEKTVTVAVAPGHTSFMVGHQKCNRNYFKRVFDINLRVIEDPKIAPYHPMVGKQ